MTRKGASAWIFFWKGALWSLHSSTKSAPTHHRIAFVVLWLKMKMARHLYRVLSSICLVAFGIALFLQIKELFSFSHREAFFEQTLKEIQEAKEQLHPQVVDIQVTLL